MEKLTVSISAKNKTFIRQYADSQHKSVSQVMDEAIDSIMKKERQRQRKDKKLSESEDGYAKKVDNFVTALFFKPQR